MMDAEFNDNDWQVPEITADDVWADPHCLHLEEQRTLPPKRLHKPAVQDGQEGGMRIGAGLHGPTTSPENKPQGLEVAVITGDVVRLSPEIPSAERVQRQFTFHQRPDDDGRHHLSHVETREWGHSRKASRQSILWFTGSGLLVCSVVVGAMMLLPRINRSNAMERRPGQTELVVAEDTSEAAKPLTEMLSKHEEAVRLYQAWLTATSKDEVVRLVRNPEKVMPRIDDNVLPRLSPEQFPPARVATFNAFEKNGMIFGVLEGSRPDHTSLAAYFVIEEGALRMDWEATTGHCSADFAMLARRQGDASAIRGWINPSDFYTLAFPEERYQSYQLLSPCQNDSLWVYALRGDPAHDMLEARFHGGAILSGTAQPEKFTLRLEPGSEDALPNQWLIVELLHNDWIAP